jgi:hypothetical protein
MISDLGIGNPMSLNPINPTRILVDQLVPGQVGLPALGINPNDLWGGVLWEWHAQENPNL